MVSDLGEKPETYLNKEQIYHLRIIDTAPPTPDSEKTTYRTFVSVSLNEQDQHMNAEAYWQLREARRALHSLNETDHERRAVEYADKQSPWVKLTEEFLNGFSVTWTTDSLTSFNECQIPVRFNFLSTDFTLAKGVKGLSARLCVKRTRSTLQRYRTSRKSVPAKSGYSGITVLSENSLTISLT